MIDSRSHNLNRLANELWDVLIIGGGVNGAGVARDLAMRAAHIPGGLRIALVEKSYFSSGTSGRNSQLIHGGLRYLKYGDFGLVREALHERRTLLEIAPSLVHPLEFLIPCYKRFDRLFYGTGLTLYDALAGSHGIQHHRSIYAAAALRLEPALNAKDFRGAVLFHDAAVHSARLVLENLLDAEARGACIANYTELHRVPGGLECRDLLTGTAFHVRARQIIDATGAWSEAAPLRLVRGSHLIFPRIQAGPEALAHFDEKGRIVFLIPWGENNDLTLVGTTDADHHSGPDKVAISEEETTYLRSIVKRLYPDFREDPITSYASLRPLVVQTGRSATATSREHRIWKAADGVLHIAGGKYTTYRSMSEEAVDMLLPDLVPGRDIPCETATTPLNIPPIPPDVEGRVQMAVEREHARRLPDLLYTSTYWGHERRLSPDWLLPLARQMGELLGWSEQRIREEAAL
ncbi:MAG: FAD-dependent oxidoreductase [Bryobacterales bacterium]|nr:FAD-dependent oxidoreductase [Bryobacterales bacterium]